MATQSAVENSIFGISRLEVAGLKSIRTKQSIDIRPLTILAGANSSGKSSMMQALLLLKQTLEAPYDPGGLLIHGPNAEFTSVDQLLFHGSGEKRVNTLFIKIGVNQENEIALTLSRSEKGGRAQLEPTLQETILIGKHGSLSEQTSVEDLREMIYGTKKIDGLLGDNPSVRIAKNRCFVQGTLVLDAFSLEHVHEIKPAFPFTVLINGIIHLPGLRGNPRRTYPVASVGSKFPGAFQNYTASVVSSWAHDSKDTLKELGDDLSKLGLTWKVVAQPLDDTQIELRVGRLPKPRQGGGKDLVNIADVGLGVSQVLPVVVSLLAAVPGQLVYIEQPEIHLHPRAQVAMASLLAKAAQRGVRVVAETHSSLVLLGIQSLVAEGELNPTDVALHWFKRDDETGETTVQSAELDAAGRFGDWPEDFADVELGLESRYLDACETRLANGNGS